MLERDRIQNYLRNLTYTDDSIKGASKYIGVYYDHAQEITNILLDELTAAQKEQKLFYLFIIHEIIIETKTKSLNFVKEFGKQLKKIITEITKNLDKVDELKQVLSVINMWEKSQIYSQRFIEVLREIAMERINKIKTVISVEKENQNKGGLLSKNEPVKYNKAFQRDYTLIQDNEVTKQNYEIKMKENAYYKKSEELNKFKDLKEKLDKVKDAQSLHDYKQDLQKAKTLALESQELLQDIINLYGSNFKSLSNQCQVEKDIWEKFSYQTYEELKQRSEQ